MILAVIERDLLMMHEDPLFNLLRDADGSAPPLTARRDGLSARVFRGYRRRRIVRSSGAVVLLLIMISSGAVLVQRVETSHIVHTTPAADIQTENPALIALDANVQLHTRTAELLVAGERRRQVIDRSQRSLTRDDALEVIQQQRNRAGLTLISQADRIGADPGRSEDAAEVYRRTIELFPNTPAASIAVRRLAQIKT